MSDKKHKEQVAQMRQRPVEECSALLGDKVEEYRKLRFKHALGQLNHSHVLGESRRHIARLHTVIAEQLHGSKERT